MTTPQQLGLQEPDGDDYVLYGDEVLRNHAAVIAFIHDKIARTARGIDGSPRVIGASDNLDTFRTSETLQMYTPSTLPGGWPTDPDAANWSIIGVQQLGAQTLQTITNRFGQWQRLSGSTGWLPWRRFDASAVSQQVATLSTTVDALQNAAQSRMHTVNAWRTVPLSLTVGGSGATSTASGSVRLPVRFSARINRWRVHIANINPRFGAFGADLYIGGVWLGTPAGNPGQATNLSQIGPGASIGISTVDGSSDEYITPWQTTPLEADTDYLLSYRHLTAGTARQMNVGGGFVGADDIAHSTGGTWTPAASVPLSVWIEAEVHPDVPVIAAFGDSLSSGVGAARPVYDSWLSRYCRDHDALPVHYTASGDTMAGWSDPNHYKWTRWAHLDRPDAVIHAMGSNDVFGGVSLADMQARWATTRALLASKVAPLIYAAQLLPRTSVTGTLEDTRRAYNAWLATQVRELYPFVPAVSGNDDAISPGFDVDGTHLTAAGYAALAATITRPPVPLT